VSLIQGLNSNPIFRLKKTWANVPKKLLEEFEILKEVTSSLSNYRGLRAAIKTAYPPCVPWIGMYLKDLTFIEDGNPDKKDDMLHFSKCKLLADVIKSIQFYQNTSYSILIYNDIRNLLMNLDTWNSEELYQMSLKAEPRK
jgi:son of sevenless